MKFLAAFGSRLSGFRNPLYRLCFKQKPVGTEPDSDLALWDHFGWMPTKPWNQRVSAPSVRADRTPLSSFKFGKYEHKEFMRKYSLRSSSHLDFGHSRLLDAITRCGSRGCKPSRPSRHAPRSSTLASRGRLLGQRRVGCRPERPTNGLWLHARVMSTCSRSCSQRART